MRILNYENRWQKLLSPDIVSLLTQIHEFKGEQTILIEAKGDTLAQLMETAKIQSTEASNKIEGIYTSDERLKKIVRDKTIPKNRNEQKIAGYRDVLATIRESHDFIPPKPTYILQLHRELYKFSGFSFGGSYKNSDNVIAEDDEPGNKFVRFQPLSAWETPEAIAQICKSYEDTVNAGNADPLLIIPMFILDFICIHPFNDGNGRMSRLLTLLLLYRCGHIAGKYISVEKLIEKSKETYYEVLHQSSVNWHQGTNDYAPFVKYMLGIIVSAYHKFSSSTKLLNTKGMSKPERIREIISSTLGKITKTEILQKCPDISQVTVQRTLNDLQKNGDIIKLSGGRYTSYIWNGEKE